MNISNSNGIVGFSSHIFLIRDWYTWYTSEKFTIEGIDDCNFEIGVHESEKKGHMLTIAVMKDNAKSVSAKITVSFLQKEITQIVDNWTVICPFAGAASGEIESIKINCEIIWYGTTDDSNPIQVPLTSFPDFKNLYLSSSLSDLQISISGEELPAHKFILAAHSPVFLSMFETDMKEKKENRVIIEGIELDVMKVVLSILYTGYDKDLNEIEVAKKVLIVAERYDMKPLKRLCEWKLFQKLEVSNVLDIVNKADSCNAEALCTACLNFIVRNREQVAGLKELETICHCKPSVICELLKTLMITPL